MQIRAIATLVILIIIIVLPVFVINCKIGLLGGVLSGALPCKVPSSITAETATPRLLNFFPKSFFERRILDLREEGLIDSMLEISFCGIPAK